MEKQKKGDTLNKSSVEKFKHLLYKLNYFKNIKWNFLNIGIY